ncbi:ABC transporter ATP-binding protein [Streptococcus hyointestinalis]|nr:ABC transporter ATP-binding protein [Streptococcus hyointestinalis]
MTVIEVNHLVCSFYEKTALEDISFEVDEGEIFGFLGPSGAGKTTTINILTGQLTPKSGTALVLGKESSQLVADDMVNLGIMSDTVGFYEKMSLYQNLAFFARFHRVPMERLEALLRRLDLWESRKTRAEKLSTGMRQRMFLIRAILHEPKIVFLDEPTSGLDPVMSQKVHELLLELKENGMTIFLTTHDMQEATMLCDKLALLHRGRICEYGSPQDILERYRDDDRVEVRMLSGEVKLVPQEDVGLYLGKAASIHSLEPTLESVFIQVTGERFDDK